jgi:hypothetical protein
MRAIDLARSVGSIDTRTFDLVGREGLESHAHPHVHVHVHVSAIGHPLLLVRCCHPKLASVVCDVMVLI